jgi:hypothetical protein
MQIDAKDSALIAALQRIADQVRAHGGVIHQSLTVHQSGPSLWISCTAPQGSEPILVIPNALFVPVSHLQWHCRNDLLEYQGDTESLSVVQRQLLEDMLVVYNRSGKMAFSRTALPSFLLREDQALTDWIQHAHPAFTLPTDGIAEQFIGTRINEQPCVENPDRKIGYLMPLIDYLNHHPNGSNYQRAENGAWCISQAHAVPGRDECFLRYTRTDSHSIAFWHGYFESNTTHIASVQCTLRHPQLGNVHILDSNAKRRGINAPRIHTDAADLTLSNLTLEAAQLPALQTLLGLALRSRLPNLNQSEAERQARQLIAQLIDANTSQYRALQALCAVTQAEFPVRSLFAQVAEHQLALLQGIAATQGR